MARSVVLSRGLRSRTSGRLIAVLILLADGPHFVWPGTRRPMKRSGPMCWITRSSAVTNSHQWLCLFVGESQPQLVWILTTWVFWNGGNALNDIKPPLVLNGSYFPRKISHIKNHSKVLCHMQIWVKCLAPITKNELFSHMTSRDIPKSIRV